MLESRSFFARAAHGFTIILIPSLAACGGVEDIGAGAVGHDGRALYAASGGRCTDDTQCHAANQFCDSGVCRPRSCNLTDAFGSLVRVSPEEASADVPPGTDLYAPLEPVVTRDGTRRYFRSNEPGYLGDRDGDVWLAERPDARGEFGAPTNLAVLNSSGTDFPVAISADGCRLYVASNREHGGGNTVEYELYQARRQPVLRTVRVEINVTGTWTGRVGAPYACTAGNAGTCSIEQDFGTRPLVIANGQARWSGVCGPNGPNLSSDGLVSFVVDGTCNVSFPATAGETCLADVDCTGGLVCTYGRCAARL